MTTTGEAASARRTRFAGVRPGSRSRRLLLWCVIALLAYTVIHAYVGGATAPDDPSQRRSSSFATGDDGTRAYADLLAQYGYGVQRQEGSLAHTGFPPRSTVILFDAPSLGRDEAADLIEFVDAGGRLVVGGADPTYLNRLVSDPPRWAPVRQANWSVDDPTDYGAVHSVATASDGAWIAPGGARVRIGDAQESLVTDMRLGLGTITFVADTTPFNNFLIGRADNAAFAVAVAGTDVREVVFAEGVHGYEGATGWAAVPVRWRLALVVLVAVGALFAWSRGVRLGPPEAEERTLAPARAEYLDALGATLARGADREASRAALAAAARALLGRRGIAELSTGAPSAATSEFIGRAVGAEPRDVALLLTDHSAVDDESLMAAARAFTAIERSASAERHAARHAGVS